MEYSNNDDYAETPVGKPSWTVIQLLVYFIITLILLAVGYFVYRNFTKSSEKTNSGLQEIPPSTEDDYRLVQSTSKETRDTNGGKLVLYYAPWCGYCKQITPQWDSVANQLPGIQVIKINSDEQPEIIKQEGVTGFPTIRFHPPKGDFIVYNGERNGDAVVAFIKNL